MRRRSSSGSRESYRDCKLVMTLVWYSSTGLNTEEEFCWTKPAQLDTVVAAASGDNRSLTIIACEIVHGRMK